MFKFTLHADLL